MRNSYAFSMPRRLLAAAFATLICVPPMSSAFADVVVRLDDGRIVRGDRPGSETNAEKIAIVTQHGRITLTRSYHWNRVRSVAIDGRELNANDLTRRFGVRTPAGSPDGKRRPAIDAKIKTVSHVEHLGRYPLQRKPRAASKPVPQSRSTGCRQSRGYGPADLYCCPLPMEARVIGVRADPLATYSADVRRHFPNGVSPGEAPFILDLMRAKKSHEVYQSVPNSAPPKVAPPKPMPSKSRSALLRRSRPIDRIGIRAVPVSSHGKSDWDALDVQLVAYDRDGSPVAVRGTVEWTLRGREQTLLRASNLRFTAMPGRAKTLATWTRSADTPLTLATHTIHSAARRNGSSRFRLPFPGPLPAHDLNVAPWGELSAIVLVPGQGAFVARQSGIPLRQSGFVREGLVGETGSLFFPQELTHGRRRAIPHLMGIQSSVRPNHGILSVQP